MLSEQYWTELWHHRTRAIMTKNTSCNREPTSPGIWTYYWQFSLSCGKIVGVLPSWKHLPMSENGLAPPWGKTEAPHLLNRTQNGNRWDQADIGSTEFANCWWWLLCPHTQNQGSIPVQHDSEENCLSSSQSQCTVGYPRHVPTHFSSSGLLWRNRITEGCGPYVLKGGEWSADSAGEA